MKVYKITYRIKDKNGKWKMSYALKYGNTQDDAVKQLGANTDMIKSVEFLGYKKGTAPKPLDK